MLTLKEMHWDNCFSYGKGNSIKFDENPLTQLVGTNGAGKTSISLMLQEILYGKNNKNIKKQDIANNKSEDKGYYISLAFEKDGNEYIVELKRTSSLKLTLLKNGEDISSHTSLNTYKTIADIIGISDFKVFCQLIYQHSTDSLDFLTATDMNRKKFLISLLQLEKYMELHELFKEKVRDENSLLNTISGSVETIELWIERNKDMDLVKQNLVPVPEVDPSISVKINELKQNVNNINSINKKIIANNQYKKDLDSLNPDYYLNSPPQKPETNSAQLKNRLTVLTHDAHGIETKIKKLSSTKGKCPQCLQEVDEHVKSVMIEEEQTNLTKVTNQIKTIKEQYQEAFNIENQIKIFEKTNSEFLRLNQLIDHSLPAQTLDKNELAFEIRSLEQELTRQTTEKNKMEKINQQITSHNSKVDLVKEQLEKMQSDLSEKNIELVEKENLISVLELLKKTFSTNGLVSYKIESSVKELERKINEYLAELSYFQMYFRLQGEKLNLEIVDDKNNVMSIANLSSGERARLNLATILAIRNILASLTNTKINLLFLDEITGTLDNDGKEKFSEILLKENLNTFFVSHEWSHPLVPRINIIKEHNISRIENE